MTVLKTVRARKPETDQQARKTVAGDRARGKYQPKMTRVVKVRSENTPPGGGGRRPSRPRITAPVINYEDDTCINVHLKNIYDFVNSRNRQIIQPSPCRRYLRFRKNIVSDCFGDVVFVFVNARNHFVKAQRRFDQPIFLSDQGGQGLLQFRVVGYLPGTGDQATIAHDLRGRLPRYMRTGSCCALAPWSVLSRYRAGPCPAS